MLFCIEQLWKNNEKANHMKKIVFALLIIAAWGYYQQPGNTKTGIAVYSELRLKLLSTSSSREVELVAIVKRDTSENCEVAKTWFKKTILHCTKDTDCEVVKNTCAYDIPKQYMKMFREEPARTTYLKAANPAINREAVLLFWGLNDEEASKFCSTIYGKIKNREILAKCI